MERDGATVDLQRDDARNAERRQRPGRRVVEAPADRGREAGAVGPPVPAKGVELECVLERPLEVVWLLEEAGELFGRYRVPD